MGLITMMLYKLKVFSDSQWLELGSPYLTIKCDAKHYINLSDNKSCALFFIKKNSLVYT